MTGTAGTRAITGWSWLLLVVQLAAVLATTFGIVAVTYESREKFAQLERSREQERELMEDWGRLLLEESTFSSPARVERIAREQLGMAQPETDEIIQFTINRQGN